MKSCSWAVWLLALAAVVSLASDLIAQSLRAGSVAWWPALLAMSVIAAVAVVAVRVSLRLTRR